MEFGITTLMPFIRHVVYKNQLRLPIAIEPLCPHSNISQLLFQVRHNWKSYVT